MKRWGWILCVALPLAGCGGSSDNTTGNVAGVVYDTTGNVVRNAHVYTDILPHHETWTNSAGSYLLTEVAKGYTGIRVELVTGNVRYFGQNVAYVTPGQVAKNLNIAISPDSQQGQINGYVTDRQGNYVSGALVFARQANGAILSSSMAVTDNTGYYVMSALAAGTAYNLLCNGQYYDGDTDTVTLNAGDNLPFNFVLKAAPNLSLPTPTNEAAEAWTSPSIATRGKEANAVENMKRIVDPRRATRHQGLAKSIVRKGAAVTRTTLDGNTVEVDVMWDPVNDPAVLGYGIYRATGSGAFRSTDFVQDPLAAIFSDQDAALVDGQTYAYEVSTVTTAFNGTTGESALSSPVSATILGSLHLGSVSSSTTPTFTWSSAFGATDYTVYLFTQYPDLGISASYNTQTPTTNTQWTYDGPPLAHGQTYYYIVLGQNGSTSNTISPVGSFTVP